MNVTIEQALDQFQRGTTSGELLAAIQTINDTHDPRGIDALIAALSYGDTSLVELAARGLTALGSAAVEPLMAALEGMHYGARYYALRALVAIGDPRARSAYEQWIGSEVTPSARRTCVRGLGQFPDTESWLLMALQDREWAIRYCAIQVFLERGLTPETRTALEGLRDDPERVVRLKLAQVLAPD